MKNKSHRLFRLGITLVFLLISVKLIAADLAPPPYSITDRNHVNVASGFVSPSLNDVAIGGNLGLSHQISTHSSQFVNYRNEFGAWGFTDNYRGGLYTTVHSVDTDGPCQPLQDADNYYNINCRFMVFRAFGGGYSQDFDIHSNGTYTPLSDPRYSLQLVSGRGYVMTAPDGTEISYGSPAITIAWTDPFGYPRFPMREIRKPNGFTISVYRMKTAGDDTLDEIHVPISSVNTNTGFQLKYVYDSSVNNNTLPAHKRLPSIEPSIRADNINWSYFNPHKIVGINRSHQYCAPDIASTCHQHDWPTATYLWPNGMPRAMFIGDSVFKVIDAEGRTTEYHHTAFDKNKDRFGVVRVHPGNTYFTPRITRIKPANATEPTVHYKYKNQFGVSSSLVCCGLFHKRWYPTREAIVYETHVGDESWTYNFGYTSQGGPNPHEQYYRYHHSSGYQAVQKAYTNTDIRKSVMYHAETWDNIYHLEENLSNRLTRVTHKLGGGSTTYKYDSRGNVTEVNARGAISTAGYPASCNTSNRKYCNQASWIKDARGNTIRYTYHAASGQVATVTLPTEHGLTAQTRYHYKKYYAHYRRNGNSISRDSRGIWLLDSESYCQNSNYVSGRCQGDDEVKTTYQYDHNNLYLRGVAVSANNAEGQTETRRTCYEYDKYGNNIGEIAPRAKKHTCI